MSAWSDWRCGAITDWQYRMECEEEERRDAARYDAMWEEDDWEEDDWEEDDG